MGLVTGLQQLPRSLSPSVVKQRIHGRHIGSCSKPGSICASYPPATRCPA